MTSYFSDWLIDWLRTGIDAMLCEVLKYKKDAKITDRITKSSLVHSTKKKLSRIGRKMIGTQVWQTYLHVKFHSFFIYTKVNNTLLEVYAEKMYTGLVAFRLPFYNVRSVTYSTPETSNIISVDHSFLQQIFYKFHGLVCQIPQLTVANFPHTVINLLQPPNSTKYIIFTETDRYNSLSAK